MDWPGNSPDLNPIEHLWHQMKRKVRDKKPRNKAELKNVLEKVWYEEISIDDIKTLVDSTPARIAAVIQAKREGSQLNIKNVYNSLI